MKTSMIFRIIAVLIVLLVIWTLTGCRDTPTDPYTHTDSSLAQLHPAFMVTATQDGGYDLSLKISGGGTPESVSMKALHSIRCVRFEVYILSSLPIALLETDYLPASGVLNAVTGEASITIATTLHYVPPAVLTRHSYAVMTVVGVHGVVSVRSDLPEPVHPVIR